MTDFVEPEGAVSARLAALTLLDVLDSPPEVEFDDIVLLASSLCETLIALVTFVTANRQWFKARMGFPLCQTSLDQSICKFAMSEAEVLVIPDLCSDARTRSNKLVTGPPFIRFYAGAPVRSSAGVPLGSICVIDTCPRPEGLTAVQMSGLQALAKQVSKLLEARRVLIEDGRRKDAELAATTTALTNERQLAELREQFVAVLGHDLRNPLTAMRAGLRMLERDHSSKDATSVLTLMKESVARMTELVESTLDLARTRMGGGLGLTRRTHDDLGSMLEHVVAEVQVSYPGCCIDADLDLPLPISCDRDRIGQLTANLLTNAATHGDPRHPIRLAAHLQDGLFRLSVANGGDPIPSELMARLFEPFSAGASNARRGLGLGLYIAAEIARAHQGNLNVTSTPTETCFLFVMPLKEF